MSTVVEQDQETPTEAPAIQPDKQPETLITPSRGWQFINVSELWRNRELLFFMGWRDVKVRYKQTVLGAAWAVFQPLIWTSIFIFIRGKVAPGIYQESMPYELFVFSALVPWLFFQSAITSAATSVISNEALITKVYFPRLAIPYASLGAPMIDMFISSSLMALMMVWFGVTPGASILFLPIIFGAIMLAALGVGTLLAALNVAYRDFRYIVPFLTQIWMLSTVTIYSANMEPKGDWYESYLFLNPMIYMVASFRAAVTGGEIPWAGFGASLMFVIVIFFLGSMYFRKAEDRFADII